MTTTRVTYLEMSDPAELRPRPAPAGDVELRRMHRPAPAFLRWLYAEIGRAHRWVDRLGWDDARIERHAGAAGVEEHLLLVDGSPAGWFELARDDGGDVEVAYFGLLAHYHGRGLGGYLLSEAVWAAWAAGARRVWVHTCDLDAPGALPNYRARGFRVYREADEPVPAAPSIG